MSLDYDALDALRSHHPAWRLLRSDHAALVVSFLQRVFVAPNVRVMAAADLAEALEDELYALRQRLGQGAFPKSATEYLNDWAAADKAWLRKFYRTGSDEAQFDLTPATEKAIAWLTQLSERPFIGTESRLLTLFDLLKQMSDGSEADPNKRLAELHKKRAEIDAEIAQVEAGHLPMLEGAALKDRFQQFTQGARALLADFREVEHNFRLLDRRVRERIALWEGGKGELLEKIMGERDAIADSDQGKSFRAFWDFLLSSRRQEELAELLDRVLALPAVAELQPDARTGRRIVIMYKWDVAEVLNTIQRERITQLSAAPAMMLQLFSDPAFDTTDTASLAWIGFGGAGLPERLIELVKRKKPLAMAGIGYGLTETNGPSHAATGEAFAWKPRSNGPASPLFDTRIVDEQGQDVAPGEAGEIWLRSVTLMQGYWQRPEATREVLQDGWLHTGDIGYLDEDGFLFVVDRLKDIVNRSGEKIASAEVESVLLQHPAIIEAAAYGVADATYGEALAVSVCLRAGMELDAAGVRAHVAAHLAPFKVPAHVLISTEPLPRNVVGKALKRQLQQQFAAAQPR